MIELVAGDAKLLVCPDIGGAIGGWTRRGTAIFRATSDEALAGTNSRLLSCFPLIPFSNRIAWGRFSFGGESFQLDKNFGDHPPHHPRQRLAACVGRGPPVRHRSRTGAGP